MSQQTNLRMGWPIVENLSGVCGIIFSLFRGSQLNSRQKKKTYNLRELTCELTSSWPPACVKGGSERHLMTPIRWIPGIPGIRGRVPNHGFVYTKRYFCLWQPSPAAPRPPPAAPGDPALSKVSIITYFDEVITYFYEIITWTSCLFTPLAI